MIRQIYTSNYNRYQMELDSALRSKNGTSVNISKAQAEAMIRQIYTSNYNRYQMELDSALRSKNGTSVNISKDLAAAAFHHVINQVAIPDNLCMKPGEGDAERPALTDGAA